MHSADGHGVTVISLDVTNSTNLEAKEHIERGDIKGPTLITAASQTDGRGRNDRSWVSEKGNFFGTFIVDPQVSVEHIAQSSFVASLALYDTIVSSVSGVQGVTLKWPNDVLIDGKKVAGILLEYQPPYVLIGIGVNLLSYPDNVMINATSISKSCGTVIAMDKFIDLLCTSMTERLQQWRTQGFCALSAQWQEKAHPKGTAIVIRDEDISDYNATYQGLDHNGALIAIREDDGSEVLVHAGDILLT